MAVDGSLCRGSIDGPSDRYMASGPARDALSSAFAEPTRISRSPLGQQSIVVGANSQSSPRR